MVLTFYIVNVILLALFRWDFKKATNSCILRFIILLATVCLHHGRALERVFKGEIIYIIKGGCLETPLNTECITFHIHFIVICMVFPKNIN